MKVLIQEKNENSVRELFEFEGILKIPLFQRAYAWEKKFIDQLIADVLQALEEDDTHFLGPLIIVQRQDGSFGKPQSEIIDGQQRITTIFLIILNTCRILAENGRTEDASTIAGNYIVKKKSKGVKSNIILHPSISDRSSFNTVISAVFDSDKKVFKEAFGDLTYDKLAPSGESKIILNRSKHIYNELNKIGAENVDSLIKFLETLFNKFTTLTLRLSNPLSAYKIFARLNGYRLPVSIGDLVRNDVFSKASEDEDIEDVHSKYWEPFYKDFDEKTSEFANFFFPNTLIENPKTQKADTFNILAKRWEKFQPQEIIKDLSKYKDIYLSLSRGQVLFDCPQEIDKDLSSLVKYHPPGVCYPFIIPFIYNSINGQILPTVACEMFKVIESFFVRRAVCKHEPTGLHAVFKGLWKQFNFSSEKSLIVSEITKHGTVKWPQNDEFKRAIKYNSIYGTPVCKFLLSELDKKSSSHSSNEIFEEEHVLPRELPSGKNYWKEHFSSEDHQKFKDTLANLIPLSPGLNKSVSNDGYPQKAILYQKESVFSSSRNFPKKYKDWTLKELGERANEIIDFSIKRWPYFA